MADIDWGGQQGANIIGAGNLIADAGGVFSGYSMARASASYANRRARQAFQSRYQWTVNDLKAAGLNPMLALREGGGGAHQVMPQVPNIPSDLVGRAVRTARDSSFAARARDLAEVQVEAGRTAVESNLQNARTSQTQAALNKAMTGVAKRDAELKGASAKAVDVNRKLAESGLPSAEALEKFDKSEMGQMLRTINRISESLQGSARGRPQR